MLLEIIGVTAPFASLPPKVCLCFSSFLPQVATTKLLNSIRRMYNPQDFIRHDYRPEFRHGVIRPNYRAVRSPPVRSNVQWRQPLPQRPLMQTHGVANGSIPNSPETFNGGHGSAVGLNRRLSRYDKDPQTNQLAN